MVVNIIRIENEYGELPPIPIRATENSAGVDISAFINSPIILKPLERALVSTGIKLEIPENFAGFIYARSGLGTKYGISLSNGVGVIDNDYRGEVKVGLINLSDKSYEIKNGDRIAQLVISNIAICKYEDVQILSQTSRDEKGFGSTGK